MKWLALIIWVLATLLALGWVDLILTAYEASPAAAHPDGGIWTAILFGPPFYLLPAWMLVSGGCLVLLLIRKPRT